MTCSRLFSVEARLFLSWVATAGQGIMLLSEGDCKRP